MRELIVAVLYVVGILLHYLYRLFEWRDRDEYEKATFKADLWAYTCKYKKQNIMAIVLYFFFGGWWIGGSNVSGFNISDFIEPSWTVAPFAGWFAESFVKANLHKIPGLKNVKPDGSE